MDPLVRQAIPAIEAAECDVAALPPVELSAEYLAAIARVMALPENRTDKSHVWPRYAALREHFRSVFRVE